MSVGGILEVDLQMVDSILHGVRCLSFLFLAAGAVVTSTVACSSGKETGVPVGDAGENAGGNSDPGARAGTSGTAGGARPSGSGGTSGGATGVPAAGAPAGGLSGNFTDAACNNGIDDDKDGLTDGFDSECSGPQDDAEDSFATGIPGDNRDPKWQDCFFDGNSGAGDDGCKYSTGCLTGELAPDHRDCAVTQACLDYCRPLTQNGCDCFGCCTIQQGDKSTVDILQVGSCSLATLDDSSACPRCTKSTDCANDCGECELCPGKTIADLPARCSEPPVGAGGASGAGGHPGGGTAGTGSAPPPAYSCDEGQQVCGTGHPDCVASQYCLLGCCVPVVR